MKSTTQEIVAALERLTSNLQLHSSDGFLVFSLSFEKLTKGTQSEKLLLLNEFEGHPSLNPISLESFLRNTFTFLLPTRRKYTIIPRFGRYYKLSLQSFRSMNVVIQMNIFSIFLQAEPEMEIVGLCPTALN